MLDLTEPDWQKVADFHQRKDGRSPLLAGELNYLLHKNLMTRTHSIEGGYEFALTDDGVAEMERRGL